jgi:hypothetical protein
MDWKHTWQKCSLHGPYQVLLLFVPIGHPTWLPGAIKASDWLKFLMIFFSDTTWRIELKCHEWSLQAANQVLLLFGPIENPRWPPVGDII